MKLVLNSDYGDASDFIIAHRTDPAVIRDIENKTYKCHNILHGLELERPVVVEIPDEATDYIITDYDGLERVYYVLDGKIFCVHASYED